jgi:DNA-binding transcriptional LysR family regulator
LPAAAGFFYPARVFELVQLRCFVAVAEELHFGRAAARMNMTQPPLSRQVQILEHHLSVSLFERTSRSVRLTPAGQSFLADARRIVRLAETAGALVQRVAHGDEGRVTLGFTAASGYSYLPRLLQSVRRQMPNVDLRLFEMVSGDQLEALQTGAIDVGLLRPPVSRADFHVIPALRERLVVAGPAASDRGYALPRTLAEFDRLPFIMYSPLGARYFHDLLIAEFYALGVSPKYVQHVSQIHSMLALVGAGLGCALVPEGARSLHLDGVHFSTLEGKANPDIELILCYRKDNQSPAVKRLVGVARQE